jgi:hypothetical protein
MHTPASPGMLIAYHRKGSGKGIRWYLRISRKDRRFGFIKINSISFKTRTKARKTGKGII